MDDQDGYEMDVRRWLDSVDAPPPRLDVSGIVRTGRMQVRRRRHLAAGSTAAVVLAVAVAVPATVQVWQPAGGGTFPAGRPTYVQASPSPARPLPTLDCAVIKLPVPDGLPGGFVDIQAIDPTGHHVLGIGAYAPEDGGAPLVLWRDGEPELIRAGGEAFAEAVNADGTVVGHTWDGERTYGWVYRDGTVTELPVPEGYPAAFARAINETGDVVGDATGGGPARPDAVVVWPADAPDQPRVLKAPDGRGVSVVGIADDGRVVGSFNDATGGYVWEPGGAGRELSLPARATSASVEATRGHWAVGDALLPVVAVSPDPSPALAEELRPVPVRWNLRSGTVEVLDPVQYGGRQYATDVNPAGNMLLGGRAPIVVRDGRPYVLPALAGGAAGVARPEAISDDGTVIAGSIDSGPDGGGAPGGGVPVVWHC